MKFNLDFVLKVDHKVYKMSGIYRIFSDCGTVNYVGISKNIFLRWKHHLKPNGKDLASKVVGFDFKKAHFEILYVVHSIHIMKKLERYYIEKYNSFYIGQNGDWGGSLSASDAEHAKRRGLRCLAKKAGVHGLSTEQKIANSSKAGKRAKELSKGIHALSQEELSFYGKKGGNTSQYLWEINLDGNVYKSKENEGLKSLCLRINFPYRKAIRTFYEHKGQNHKINCFISRYLVENSVDSVETQTNSG